MLPGGRAVLFTITAATGELEASQVAVLDLETGTYKVLVPGGNHAHYVPTPGGHLVVLPDRDRHVGLGEVPADQFELQHPLLVAGLGPLNDQGDLRDRDVVISLSVAPADTNPSRNVRWNGSSIASSRENRSRSSYSRPARNRCWRRSNVSRGVIRWLQSETTVQALRPGAPRSLNRPYRQQGLPRPRESPLSSRLWW
jgi:hypothetical protein